MSYLGERKWLGSQPQRDPQNDPPPEAVDPDCRPAVEHQIPVGLCQCGCGQRTKPATRNRVDKGWVKGQPLRYAPGHNHGRNYLVNEDGCWIWQGHVISSGYGQFKSRPAHCVLYEQLVGPIPEGMELDHVCHDPETCTGGTSCPHRACVNPAHLKPVTPRENVLRSNGPCAVNARKTHCIHGHPLSGPNLRVDKHGSRACRACAKERKRRYRSERDCDGNNYDREQDTRWDMVAGCDFHPATPPDGLPPIGVAPEELPPTRTDSGAVPGAAARSFEPASGAGSTPSAASTHPF